MEIDAPALRMGHAMDPREDVANIDYIVAMPLRQGSVAYPQHASVHRFDAHDAAQLPTRWAFAVEH